MALGKIVLSIVGSIGSIVVTTVLVRSIIHDYIPLELHEYLFFGFKNMFTKFSNQLTMVIAEFDGLINNEIYEVAEIYLGNKLSPNIHRLKISKPEKEKNFNIAMECMKSTNMELGFDHTYEGIETYDSPQEMKNLQIATRVCSSLLFFE